MNNTRTTPQTSDQINAAILKARTVGGSIFDPMYKQNPGVGSGVGISSHVPSATTIDGQLAGIAQTRYNAPRGWWTAAGTKGEGYVWRAPNGKEVHGHAPAVFANYGG